MIHGLLHSAASATDDFWNVVALHDVEIQVPFYMDLDV